MTRYRVFMTDLPMNKRQDAKVEYFDTLSKARAHASKARKRWLLVQIDKESKEGHFEKVERYRDERRYDATDRPYH